MDNTLIINVKANYESIVAAEKEMGVFQQAINSVNVVIKQTQNQWSDWTNTITAASTAFKAVHLFITNYIIAPLASAVNSFVALGDQISKTSQRIGMSTETLGGLKFAAEQCGANFQIGTSDKCVPAPFDPRLFSLKFLHRENDQPGVLASCFAVPIKVVKPNHFKPQRTQRGEK